jgi:hypothetical protein
MENRWQLLIKKSTKVALQKNRDRGAGVSTFSLLFLARKRVIGTMQRSAFVSVGSFAARRCVSAVVRFRVEGLGVGSGFNDGGPAFGDYSLHGRAAQANSKPTLYPTVQGS